MGCFPLTVLMLMYLPSSYKAYEERRPKNPLSCYQNVTCIYSDKPKSQWLLQVTPNILSECLLQTGFLHTLQHCFTLSAYLFVFCSPNPACMQNLIPDITLSHVATWICSKLRHQTYQ